ncbi:Uncharacterised protein [Mycobacteroides abscessus subsp. abscessus]|nr:Uncharacterised protein [Mycobacteroides abscessus subsp. abscessus]
MASSSAARASAKTASRRRPTISSGACQSAVDAVSAARVVAAALSAMARADPRAASHGATTPLTMSATANTTAAQPDTNAMMMIAASDVVDPTPIGISPRIRALPNSSMSSPVRVSRSPRRNVTEYAGEPVANAR